MLSHAVEDRWHYLQPLLQYANKMEPLPIMENSLLQGP
jgi:hypothetical protein